MYTNYKGTVLQRPKSIQTKTMFKVYQRINERV